jgi:hypothetical protein
MKTIFVQPGMTGLPTAFEVELDCDDETFFSIMGSAQELFPKEPVVSTNIGCSSYEQLVKSPFGPILLKFERAGINVRVRTAKPQSCLYVDIITELLEANGCKVVFHATMLSAKISSPGAPTDSWLPNLPAGKLPWN